MDAVYINQTLVKTGNAEFTVILNVNGEEKTYEYSECNGIYPLYNSLIRELSEFDGVTVVFSTSEPGFADEISGNQNKNTSLLSILKNVIARQAIVLNVDK